MPCRMRCKLNAHQRNANEIADPFLFNDAHCLFGVPFGHQHKLAANGEALQHQRYGCGDVEQGHVYES